MLSNDLRNLAADLRQLVDDGNLHRRHVETAIGYLKSWADQVAAMEERPVPAHQRGELPEGVVSLTDVRARRQAEAFVAQQMGRGPGGAA